MSENQLNYKKRSSKLAVGNYILGKVIGEGTFGKVRLAKHTVTSENVAIKVLEKRRIEEYGDTARVKNEIAILKKVNHPTICKLYEIIETSHYLYLVMEYAQKGELFKYIVEKKRLIEK